MLRASSQNESVAISPLVVFRIIFGLMMAASILRTVANGWVTELYVDPTYYFTYYGFDWVTPLGESGMYMLFTVVGVAALGIAFGAFYRFSAAIFFLGFTYIELIDKTNYLNHYYFVSLIAMLLIFLPAHLDFSVDAMRNPSIRRKFVPKWTINIIKFQLAVVYIFAGIAKLNYDWLMEAMPLNNWLKHQTELPIIGGMMKYDATAYAFSWFGAFYDLTIVFFLMWNRTRLWAYGAVVVFHVLTAIMFPIGMFPYVMILSTLIFFSADFHDKVLSLMGKLVRRPRIASTSITSTLKSTKLRNAIVIAYISLQILIPMRYLLYPGELFWTEQGYRFSWRVMLIEKAGTAQFFIETVDGTGHLVVDNMDYLSPQQEKMMSTQPDFILQYAHMLRDQYSDTVIVEGDNRYEIDVPVVRAQVYVRLHNHSQQMVDQNCNLAAEKRGFPHKNWILPLKK